LALSRHWGWVGLLLDSNDKGGDRIFPKVYQEGIYNETPSKPKTLYSFSQLAASGCLGTIIESGLRNDY